MNCPSPAIPRAKNSRQVTALGKRARAQKPGRFRRFLTRHGNKKPRRQVMCHDSSRSSRILHHFTTFSVFCFLVWGCLISDLSNPFTPTSCTASMCRPPPAILVQRHPIHVAQSRMVSVPITWQWLTTNRLKYSPFREFLYSHYILT